jgi:hypothetical protein
MDFNPENGSSFHLEVLGYQYPDIENEVWDSDWLRLYMAASLPQGAWSVTNSFLLTFEVKSLADWLDAVATNMQAQNEIGFTEPNLSFEVINPTGIERSLRVHFAIECLPPWARRSEYGTEDVFADFSLSDIDLHAAAESLRFELSLYPQRAAY